MVLKDPPGAIYEIYGANDLYTEHYIERAAGELGMKVIARIPSVFQANGLPPSTLYTYHEPELIYLMRPQDTPQPSP